MSEVIFAWGVNPFFGWGVIGLNWLLHWPGTALCGTPDMRGMLTGGDPRMTPLEERLAQSRKFQASLQTSGSLGLVADKPVFVAMGNSLAHPAVAHGKSLTGNPTIACPVFEDEAQARARAEALRRYDLVIAASAWNRDILTDAGLTNVRLCHQGIDMALFNPTQRRRDRTDGRFRVFSGGKCEFRKGQDLVLQAFARFAEKHDDAVLVACWGSPWAGLALEFADTAVGAPPGAEIGLPNFGAWAQANGIKPHQIEIVPRTPNCLMPAVYGGCDVGLFASRAEGGTNLMAMECMGCGVPAIVTIGTGHDDLRQISQHLCEASEEAIRLELESAYDHRIPYEVDMSEWDWPVRLGEMQAIVETAL